jgi:hypothetical protein
MAAIVSGAPACALRPAPCSLLPAVLERVCRNDRSGRTGSDSAVGGQASRSASRRTPPAGTSVMGICASFRKHRT